MRDDLGPDDLDGLLERPLVAVLATYRSTGDVLLSPVWHRWRDGGFDVVTGGDDVKARHLRGDPRASIVLFESEPPYRGIEVRGRAVLGHVAGHRGHGVGLAGGVQQRELDAVVGPGDAVQLDLDRKSVV